MVIHLSLRRRDENAANAVVGLVGWDVCFEFGEQIIQQRAEAAVHLIYTQQVEPHASVFDCGDDLLAGQRAEVTLAPLPLMSWRADLHKHVLAGRIALDQRSQALAREQRMLMESMT